MIKSKLLTTSGAPAMPYIRKEMAKIKKEMKAVKIRLPLEINKLGKRAGRLMGERVRLLTKRTGSTGDLAARLEDGMKFKKYGVNGFQVSMSSVNLPVYWAMINYGGFLSPEVVYGNWSDNKGRSDPNKRGGRGEGTFDADRTGTPMAPRKPIKGFHYIAYAYRKVRAEIRSGMFTAKVKKSTR